MCFRRRGYERIENHSGFLAIVKRDLAKVVHEWAWIDSGADNQMSQGNMVLPEMPQRRQVAEDVGKWRLFRQRCIRRGHCRPLRCCSAGQDRPAADNHNVDVIGQRYFPGRLVHRRARASRRRNGQSRGKQREEEREKSKCRSGLALTKGVLRRAEVELRQAEA